MLIADGNLPAPDALVRRGTSGVLNLAPDLVRVTAVLGVIGEAIPIEAAHVMVPDVGDEPPIFEAFRRLLPGLELTPLARFDFYDAARGPDLALAIATGERRLYANLLVTIGVVPPGESER